MINRFDKDTTNYAKGIAIMLLIVHHISGIDPGVPITDWMGASAISLWGNAGKVCVAIFTVLSGYGMTLGGQGKNKWRYGFGHIRKVWGLYLWGFFGMLLINIAFCGSFQGIYGTGWNAVYYFLKDMLGLQNFLVVTPTVSGVSWYIETIFVCYLLYPIFDWLFDRLRRVDIVLLLIAYIPWALYYIRGDYSVHTDRELYYLFSFLLGMYLAKHNILNRFLAKIKAWKVLLAVALLVGFTILRFRVCLPADPFLAMAILLVCGLLKGRIQVLDSFLGLLGKNEFYIYLMHPAILVLLSGIGFLTIGFRFWATLLLALALSVGAEGLRKYLVKYKYRILRSTEKNQNEIKG